MATNIPDEAISIHNEMVVELSISMTDQEFKKLKRLLEDVPLTETDKRKIKSVQKLFSCLVDKTFIFYGDYEKLKPKLTLVKPSLCTIVQRHVVAIEKILRPEPEPELEPFEHEEITIMMHRKVYKTWEGSSAAFVDCKVDPVPDRIVWKRDKTTPLTQKVLHDNHKYYYSPQTPTLVIRDPNKTMDEAQYQCRVGARGTNVDSDIVQVQVADTEPFKSTSATNIQGPSGDVYQTTSRTPGPSEELASSKHTTTSGLETLSRKRKMSQSEDQPVSKRECIQVSIDISAAKHPSEPSSIHLAEEFKHYLLDDGTIQLSDESQTVLQIDETSIKITPHSLPEDGTPYINVSHGEFTVPVGKTAILQAYVIASTEATSIQWFKVEDGHHIAIEIDNQRYYGGSDVCPTLIIRGTTTDDQGQYMCLATNSKGTSSSDTSSLYIVSDEERIEDIQETPTVTTKKHLVSDGSTHEMKQYIKNFIQETEGKEIIGIKQDIIDTGRQLEENTSHFHKLAQQLKALSNQLLEEIKLQSAQMLSRYKQQEAANIKLLHTYKQELEIYETQLNEKVNTCKSALELGSEKVIHDVGYEIKFPASRPVKPSLITPSVSPEELKKILLGKSFEMAGSLLVAPQKGRETETIDKPGDVYTLLPEIKTLEECSIAYAVTSICPTKNGETWTCTADHTLTLLDKTGTTKQTISHTTWISDICLSPTTNMVWVCDGNQNILELVSGQLVRRFRIREKSLCICSTASNHMLVGTIGRITKYTPEGSQVLTSPATDHGEPIVCCPGKISECLVTHNVAVTDYGKTGYGSCVIVLDRYFKQLFVIDGKVSITSFRPRNNLFDNTGILIIQDTFNNNLVLFSGQGKILRTLCKDIFRLSAIGVDKDNVLWVIQRNKLRLVQYYGDI